jgi:hypothetical protein
MAWKPIVVGSIGIANALTVFSAATITITKKGSLTMKLSELKERVTEELRNTRHNGSLLGTRFSEDDERDWESVLENGRLEIEDIEREVNEKYGLGLTLGQFGRSGATVAPIEWVREGSWGWAFSVDMDDYEGLEGYNELRKMLGALELINARCRAWCRAQGS